MNQLPSGTRCAGPPPGSEIVRAPALLFELFRVEVLEPLVCVDVLWPFVVSNAHNPREAKCESARVMWASLDLVVRDLDHRLGSHMESPTLLGRREAAQPLRHRLELRIREALERLPDHLEPASLVVPYGEPVDRKSTRLNSSHSSPSRMPSSA